MVIDRLERLERYLPRPRFAEALGYLRSINAQTQEGERKFLGDELFVRVFRCDTRDAPADLVEAHRRYIDVQLVLEGLEVIEWHPIEGLNVSAAYDNEKDVEFFNRLAVGMQPLLMQPGYFAIFYPQDGHLPQLHATGTVSNIKKAVMKVSVELLNNRAD